MANVLWGEEHPQIWLISGVFPDFHTELIDLPYPTDYDYFFVPDKIEHTRLNGSRTIKWRGFRPVFTLYYDLVDKEFAKKIHEILNLSRTRDLFFKPHKDFSLGFYVRVNEDEGWNFKLFHKSQAYGYGPVLLVCRATRWEMSLPSYITPEQKLPIGGAHISLRV